MCPKSQSKNKILPSVKYSLQSLCLRKTRESMHVARKNLRLSLKIKVSHQESRRQTKQN